MRTPIGMLREMEFEVDSLGEVAQIHGWTALAFVLGMASIEVRNLLRAEQAKPPTDLRK